MPMAAKLIPTSVGDGDTASSAAFTQLRLGPLTLKNRFIKAATFGVGRHMFRTYPFEEAFFPPQARQFREALSMPLILLGGVNRMDTVETAMKAGVEFVAMARAPLRDPDLVNKFARRPPAMDCACTAPSAWRRSTSATFGAERGGSSPRVQPLALPPDASEVSARSATSLRTNVFCTFPLGVRGKSSTWCSSSGHFCFARPTLSEVSAQLDRCGHGAAGLDPQHRRGVLAESARRARPPPPPRRRREVRAERPRPPGR